METRGGLIIRKLCVLLQPKTIYVALASVLQTNSDLAFIGVMVEVCGIFGAARVCPKTTKPLYWYLFFMASDISKCTFESCAALMWRDTMWRDVV